jgi:hypothetical protein
LTALILPPPIAMPSASPGLMIRCARPGPAKNAPRARVAQAESRQTIAELKREVVELKLALHDLQAADHERVSERIAAIKTVRPESPVCPQGWP